ncbi:MAG TPA: SRPBCC domain-containing protein [Candidatus Thermoplasmatota archaeon]|nr:SRPBCC domain-containing protein [Candidatus Thermoplasmatota archaeon]
MARGDVDELVSARVFPVPRERLFGAFADPERLARWWGPRGSVNVFEAFDLRPGGRWRFEMRAPDGRRFAMEKTFVEVDPPRRVVLRHEQAGHDFTMTMLYDEVPSGTRLTWRVRFATPAQREAVEAPFLAANEENFDRLAAEVAR